MSFLSIQKLSKTYGDLMVLEEVNFDVQQGEFVVLLGPSGCGKSTLLNAIAGLDDITSGKVLVDGQDVSDCEPKDRNMSMVFQSYALYPTMTVRKNLEFGLKIARISTAEMARRVDWVAELLEIKALLDRKPGQLSGGQRQRVAIGRALVRESKICLFDEPLSNLDAKLRNTMRLEIRRLFQKLGGTAVYVTHDQVEAMTMADRVAVLNKGRIEQFDEPMLVYDKPKTLFVASFLGNPGVNLAKGRYNAASRTVTTDFGLSLSMGAYEFTDGGKTDEDVIIGIRPEGLASVSDALDEQTLEASVDTVEMLGADAVIWLRIQDFRWSMKISVANLPPLSDVIWIRPDVGRISVFSENTHKRL